MKCLFRKNKFIRFYDKLLEWLGRNSSATNNRAYKEVDYNNIKEKICCGSTWHYFTHDWSTAKCHKCGMVLNDNQRVEQ